MLKKYWAIQKNRGHMVARISSVPGSHVDGKIDPKVNRMLWDYPGSMQNLKYTHPHKDMD